MGVDIFSYSIDGKCKRIVKKLLFNGIHVKPQSDINYQIPFMIINGSNENHHRTYRHVKKVSDIDGYFHIDNHDDIALNPSSVRI